MKYKFISKLYTLLDIFYFNKPNTSPRNYIINLVPEGNIKLLEMCIGTGENSILIAKNENNAEITGIDLSQDMLKIAKEKILKNNIHNINTFIMDATNINFPNNYFDIVLISLVLHETNNTTRFQIINEAKRVLKPEGKIIIIEWDKPNNFIKKFMFSFIKLSEPKGFNEFLNLDMKKYLKSFSLKIISESKCDYTKIIEVIKE